MQIKITHEKNYFQKKTNNEKSLPKTHKKSTQFSSFTCKNKIFDANPLLSYKNNYKILSIFSFCKKVITNNQ